jgi:hypothetical protein
MYNSWIKNSSGDLCFAFHTVQSGVITDWWIFRIDRRKKKEVGWCSDGYGECYCLRCDTVEVIQHLKEHNSIFIVKK